MRIEALQAWNRFLWTIARSSRQRKTPVPEACNFIKKETLAHAFFCEFCEFSKNTFFREQLWATASEVSMCLFCYSCNTHFFVKYEGPVIFINAVLITLIIKLFCAMLFA